MRAFLCLTLALTAMAAAPAKAKDDDLGDQTVCVGGPQWRASLADSAAIRTDPIPASYRRLFESTAPCTRWALDEQSLIDWHLRFGTAESIVPALAYLERDYVRDEPAPEAYRTALERAWRTALADLRRAREVQQPAGANYSAQSRFMEASRPIQRFSSLVETREKFVFLATQFLRAAEEFGSLPLLDRADPYLRAALAGNAFLGPLEGQPPTQGLLYFNLRTYVTDDLEMRAAVLRASLTRTAADLERAETAVQARERPYYRRLAEDAFSHGDDFCDIASEAEQIGAAQQACLDDRNRHDEPQTRVMNQLLARALLDLVTDRDGAATPSGSDELALRLLNIERLPDRNRCCLRDPVDDIVRLRLARASHFRRLLAGHGETERLDGSYGSDWDRALTDLENAERLIAPHEAPARVRRVALAWLELWQQGGTLFRREDYEERTLPTDNPARQRYAGYLRHLLAGLNAIATGLPPAGN